jgi:hypothetical protein
MRRSARRCLANRAARFRGESAQRALLDLDFDLDFDFDFDLVFLVLFFGFEFDFLFLTSGGFS